MNILTERCLSGLCNTWNFLNVHHWIHNLFISACINSTTVTWSAVKLGTHSCLSAKLMTFPSASAVNCVKSSLTNVSMLKCYTNTVKMSTILCHHFHWESSSQDLQGLSLVRLKAPISLSVAGQPNCKLQVALLLNCQNKVVWNTECLQVVWVFLLDVINVVNSWALPGWTQQDHGSVYHRINPLFRRLSRLFVLFVVMTEDKKAASPK